MQDKLALLKEQHKALAAFMAAHDVIFKQAEAMQTAITETESEIKIMAREKGEDIEQDGVFVKVTRAFRKIYDYAAIPKKDLKIIDEAGGVTHTIVPAVIEALVRDEKIDRKVRALAFREEEQTPRVSITVKL